MWSYSFKFLLTLAVDLLEEFDIDWDPLQHRIRCSGHILNLTSNAFMHSYDEDAVDEGNNEPARQRGVQLPTVEQMKIWRRKGARGKARNFAFRVVASPQTVAKWLKFARRLVPRPNSTRWSSEDFMIEVLLELRPAYEQFWQRYPTECPVEDKLTEEDWIQLEKLHHFLRVLADTTKFLEGPRATLERVLPTMEYILTHSEEGKVISLAPFLTLLKLTSIRSCMQTIHSWGLAATLVGLSLTSTTLLRKSLRHM